MYLPLPEILHFHMASSYGLMFFHSGLEAMNSLSFCLPGDIIISPSFLKDSIAGYSFLSWQVIGFFQYFKHTIPLLSGLQGISWKVCWKSYKSCFCFCFSASIFSLPLTFDSLIMCQHRFLFVYLFGVCWTCICVCIFSKMWVVSGHYFFKYSLCSFSFFFLLQCS